MIGFNASKANSNAYRYSFLIRKMQKVHFIQNMDDFRIQTWIKNLKDANAVSILMYFYSVCQLWLALNVYNALLA
jgi:hypothetical protein